MPTTYLDNNATTPLAPEVIETIRDAAERLYANPSSVHRPGQEVRQQIELARQQVALLLGSEPREITFTSGGTEANNLALRGLIEPELWHRAMNGPWNPEDADESTAPAVVTLPVEHSAVRDPAKHLHRHGAELRMADVDHDGRVSPNAIAAILDELTPGDASGGGGRTVVVSIQWANNETGVLQPVAEIGDIIAAKREALRGVGIMRPRLFFHIDATQAVGKVPVDVNESKADLLTCSAHKIHGPKGSGALYVRRLVKLSALQLGGSQERERRPGTENTIGILALGKAAELARVHLANTDECDTIRKRRDRFEQAICERIPSAVVNSAGAPRLSNTASIAFPGVEAEAILLGLSERGVCASAGAACSSGSLEPSSVLTAMHLDEPTAHGTVRFSLSRYTTDTDIDHALEVVPAVVERLMKVLPTG
ncbi:MAG: cysteine desulfurase family protein [Planctomycetota bacterium]